LFHKAPISNFQKYMSESKQPNQNDDLEPLIRRLDEEFGPRREREPAPVYGEARPVPEQGYRLRLPLGAPRAVWVLLGLNIIIFLISGVLSGNLFTPSNAALFFLGAKVNQLIAAGQYWRLITSMFLHANLIHVGVNCYSLYAIGPQTERYYGTPRFLALYFISGLAGGVASYAFSASPGVGASGAIFGLVGGLAAFYYTSRALLGEISRQQLGSLITIIMINLFIGLSSGGLIDNWAHMGGLAGGVLVGWLLAPRFEVDERIFPPQVARRSLAFGWPGALAFLAILVFLVMTINPPIR
jgi:rhomboid protease GluP